jgi:hypothetical protein
MMGEIAKHEIPTEVLEKVVVDGDLSRLTPTQRMGYYRAVCESLGLNPLTRPFGYIRLDGKLILYAHKNATDQLRRIYKISIEIVDKRIENDIFIVHVKASTPEGRADEDIGAVSLKDCHSEDDRVNRLMKAVTKAKRRVTLSLVGLGFLDESELETVSDAQVVTVDEPGEIKEKIPKTDQPSAVEEPEEDQEATRKALLRQLFAAAAEHGLIDDQFEKQAFADFLREEFGVEGRSEMTKEMIEEAIALLGDPDVRSEILRRAEKLRFGVEEENEELPF